VWAKIKAGRQEGKEVKVDLDSLRSLSELGIDISFLDSFAESPAQTALGKTADSIETLSTMQTERLTNADRRTKSERAAPEKEKELAADVTQQLVELASKATPGDLIDAEGLRHAAAVGPLTQPQKILEKTATVPEQHIPLGASPTSQ